MEAGHTNRLTLETLFMLLRLKSRRRIQRWLCKKFLMKAKACR
jgi:hypothetical protein